MKTQMIIKKMKKKRFNPISIILLCIIICSSVAAYHYAAEIKGNIHDNMMETYKFDATRMVNKVLDSTDIAYLHGGFDKDGRFAIYRNDFIKKYNVQITNKRYYLSDDCDSLEHSIEKRIGKCWFLEFIQIDSISEDIYRLHYAMPYKSKGGFYDFNINDYVIVDSFMVEFKAAYDTLRYVMWNNVERFRKTNNNKEQ